MNRTWKFAVTLIGMVALMTLSLVMQAGCSGRKPSPLLLCHRKSLLAGGYVVIITNSSTEPVYHVGVSVTYAHNGVTYPDPAIIVATILQSGKEVEYGGLGLLWVPGNPWILSRGDVVAVSCEGYEDVHMRIQ